MRKLMVFDNVSLDGYFVDARGDMSWAHAQDPEWLEFVAGNASGGGALVFGRVTYEMMASYWPTPQAVQQNPLLAERMNALPKVVFSRTLKAASWQNTRLLSGDLAVEAAKLKQEPGPDLVILGSGQIVAALGKARLIDGYRIALHPVVLGGGRTLFEGATRQELTLTESRAFKNGIVVLSYDAPATTA